MNPLGSVMARTLTVWVAVVALGSDSSAAAGGFACPEQGDAADPTDACWVRDSDAVAAGVVLVDGQLAEEVPPRRLAHTVVASPRADESPTASIRRLARDASRFGGLHPSLTEIDGQDGAVDALLQITRGWTPEFRVAAVEVLAEIDSPRATAALGVVLYENAFPPVRRRAAAALAHRGDDASMWALASALEEEHDRDVRGDIERGLDIALARRRGGGTATSTH